MEEVKSTLQAVEGIYKNGMIELSEAPQGVTESRVIVTFLGAESAARNGAMMQFGMFAGSHLSTKNDFQTADFQGDA
ncbi:MAG: hypothetical protein DCF22_24590 [Leptolyngbya sp.]|nr:MAG: hypothetical protein DCF22_24590 [Leptolyngbya sp.]